MASLNKDIIKLSNLIKGLILLMKDDMESQVLDNGDSICSICTRDAEMCYACPLSSPAFDLEDELEDLAKRLATEELLEQ